MRGGKQARMQPAGRGGREGMHTHAPTRIQTEKRRGERASEHTCRAEGAREHARIQTEKGKSEKTCAHTRKGERQGCECVDE